MYVYVYIYIYNVGTYIYIYIYRDTPYIHHIWSLGPSAVQGPGGSRRDVPVKFIQPSYPLLKTLREWISYRPVKSPSYIPVWDLGICYFLAIHLWIHFASYRGPRGAISQLRGGWSHSCTAQPWIFPSAAPPRSSPNPRSMPGFVLLFQYRIPEIEK